MTEARLSGGIAIAAAPAVVAAALHDPAVLHQMSPGRSEISPDGPDAWPARIEKATGPVTLRLAARIVLQTLADGTSPKPTARGKA